MTQKATMAALVLALLAGCGKAQTTSYELVPGPAASGDPQLVPSSRPPHGCDACSATEVCVREVAGGQCGLVTTPAEMIDGIGIPKWGDGVANIRQEFVDRLVVLKNTRLVGGPTMSSLMACTFKPGVTPNNCCNRCAQGRELTGFPRISVRAPDGREIRCGGSCCKPFVCPPGLPSEEEAFDIAGWFRSPPGYHHLTFQLASTPW